MKKLIAILMVVAILTSMSVSVSAATTTLSTTVPEATYTMNIPADQEIPFGSTSTNIGTVTITDSEGFAVGKNVYVKVEYNGLFQADGVSSTIPYAMEARGSSEEGGNSVTYSDNVLTTGYLSFLGTDSGSVNTWFFAEREDTVGRMQDCLYDQRLLCLISSTDWGKALGGEYSTTITFTAQVSNEQPTA